jgi:hypothetical protein
MTDGTVTRMLEAYTFESVEARCVEQYETTAAHDRGGWRRAAPEDRMLVRRVDLVGGRSGICYAQAESHIAVDRLPNTFHTALAGEPAGIGAASHLRGVVPTVAFLRQDVRLPLCPPLPRIRPQMPGVGHHRAFPALTKPRDRGADRRTTPHLRRSADPFGARH